MSKFKVIGTAKVECLVESVDESEAIEQAYDLMFQGWKGDFSSLLHWSAERIVEGKNDSGKPTQTTV